MEYIDIIDIAGQECSAVRNRYSTYRHTGHYVLYMLYITLRLDETKVGLSLK